MKTLTFQGIDAAPVEAQVQIAPGLPAFIMVGLPDKAVAESRERVRASLVALGLSLPAKRIVVNLAPAELRKEGGHFDLPVALGILVSLRIISSNVLEKYLCLGELSLDARVAPVIGVLPAAIHAFSRGLGLICPEAQGQEAAWARGVQVLAVPTLHMLIRYLRGDLSLEERLRPELEYCETDEKQHKHLPNLADVHGQESAKRALEIAAAGGHNLLFLGPPGAGKSLLARCLPDILPPLSRAEALEISMIHSLSGTLDRGALLRLRPFRAPHHSASQVSLIGGGHRIKPGEVSLAHRGVLFLDEFPEFARAALEALRQPLEEGLVTIARANAHTTYPAQFQLVAAMNPCRCGYLGDPARACTQAPICGRKYQDRISGPLWDRIDLRIDVPAVRVQDLQPAHTRESSATVRGRVVAARRIQVARFASQSSDQTFFPHCNAELQGRMLEKVAAPDSGGRTLLMKAIEQWGLSARGYHRILRLARTLADLAQAEHVSRFHVAEALSYRIATAARKTTPLST